MNVIIDERKENAMTFNKVLLSWIVILIITTSIYLFWQLGDINDVFNQSILINVRFAPDTRSIVDRYDINCCRPYISNSFEIMHWQIALH